MIKSVKKKDKINKSISVMIIRLRKKNLRAEEEIKERQ
jgi:hypothetical protein